MRRWFGWIMLLMVLGVALAFGASRGGHDTQAARAERIEAQIRCPTCLGLSVAQSDAKAAKAIRDDVTAQIAAGHSDDQIEQSIVSRYGADILLSPPASGIGGLVWVLPIMVFVIGGAGIALAFRRWKGVTSRHATDEDRVIVARALFRHRSGPAT